MKVLLLSQHFTPEITAGRFRMQPIVAALIARGHEVEVICAVPNHPQGVIQAEFKGALRVRRKVEGAKVDYVWVLTTPRKTLASRLGSYGSYATLATLDGIVSRRPDVILASSPPLPVGAAGAALALRHRAPWVLDVRDIWPEAAVDLGELSSARVISLLESLERFLYRQADAIVTVNEAFRSTVASRAPAGKPVEVVPNGTTREWLEAGEADPDRARLGLAGNEFIVAYAGNIGLAHGLETAVEAAGLLGPGFRLLLIGDGPRREEIAARAASLADGNVELLGLMSSAEAASWLRAADVLLVSEQQERTVASKLYDYGAIGRPVVAACRGELRRVVEAADVGIAVEHGDAEALATAVRALRDDPERAAGMAGRGRDFARAHLRETQADRMADLLERVSLTR